MAGLLTVGINVPLPGKKKAHRKSGLLLTTRSLVLVTDSHFVLPAPTLGTLGNLGILLSNQVNLI